MLARRVYGEEKREIKKLSPCINPSRLARQPRTGEELPGHGLEQRVHPVHGINLAVAFKQREHELLAIVG